MFLPPIYIKLSFLASHSSRNISDWEALIDIWLNQSFLSQWVRPPLIWSFCFFGSHHLSLLVSTNHINSLCYLYHRYLYHFLYLCLYYTFFLKWFCLFFDSLLYWTHKSPIRSCPSFYHSFSWTGMILLIPGTDSHHCIYHIVS